MTATIGKAGYELVASESYEPSDTDMSAQLTRLKGKQFDVLLIGGAEMAGAIAYKQARALGITQPIYGNPPLVIASIVNSLGKDLNGLKVPGYLANLGVDVPKSDPMYGPVNELTNLVQQKYSSRADTGYGTGWDGVNLTAMALQGATIGLTDLAKDRTAVKDAFKNLKGFVGSYCEGDMTQWQDIPTPMLPVEVQDGKVVVVGEKISISWKDLSD